MFEPSTGELKTGLGEGREESQRELTAKEGNSIVLLRAVFMAVGGNILLALTGNSVILGKYLANGLTDPNFDGGEVNRGEFSIPGLRSGLDAKHNRIVISWGYEG